MSRAMGPCVIGISVLMLAAAACGVSARPPAQSGQPRAEAPPAQAPAVTEALAPTPTPRPQPGAGSLAIPARPAARVPADIPAHMAWEGLGGGSVGNACIDIDDAPGSGSDAPAREAMMPVPLAQWCYCNVEETTDMQLEAVLTLSDGAQEIVTGYVEPQGLGGEGDPLCATFGYRFYAVPPRSPITLTTRLSGRDIVEPLTPVAGQVRFEGWRPEEPLRVVVYTAPDPDDPAAKVFAADLRASADADGVFTAVTAETVGDPIPAVTLFVIGRDSGCQTFDPGLYMVMGGKIGQGCTTLDPDTAVPDTGVWSAGVTWAFEGPPAYHWEPCRGAPPSSLRPGLRAAVLPPDAELPILAGPGLQYEQTGFLEPGAVIDVVSGPSCANGAVWWQVDWPDGGASGWTVEHDLEQTRLERRP
jgi:hypothetical protein